MVLAVGRYCPLQVKYFIATRLSLVFLFSYPPLFAVYVSSCFQLFVRGSGLSRIKSVSVQLRTKNIPQKLSTAFTSLIGGARSRFEHFLVMTSSTAGKSAHMRAYSCRDIVISFEQGNCPGRHLNIEVFQLFWVCLQA